MLTFGDAAWFVLSADKRPAKEICNDPEASLGNIIPACTALIRSGRYGGSGALAWEVRGRIEAARGNRDAAIGYFRTALYYERGREVSLAGLRKLGTAP